MTPPDRVRAMAAAVAKGDLHKVALLLRAGVPASHGDGDPFLVTAARFAQPEVFDLLVAHGAPIDLPELLEWAVDGDGGRGEISEHIVERVLTEGHPPAFEVTAALRGACASGNLWAVERLLRHRADVDAVDPPFGDFPLFNAVLNGHLDIVRCLLAAGADPNLRGWVQRDSNDPQVSVSLHELATELGFDDIAELLR